MWELPGGRVVIQAFQRELAMGRYDLTDLEWKAIEPFLPDKPGVCRGSMMGEWFFMDLAIWGSMGRFARGLLGADDDLYRSSDGGRAGV
jgi:hypothetical protein